MNEIIEGFPVLHSIAPALVIAGGLALKVAGKVVTDRAKAPKGPHLQDPEADTPPSAEDMGGQADMGDPPR